MSDHNHPGHNGHSGHSDDGDGNDPAHGISHGAGHEMDVPPTKELFNIVWGLGALTLLSLVTCVQLFNNQQRDLMTERGSESSQVLTQYRQSMESATRTAGESSFKDSNGAEVKQRYVPLTVARELVLSKPERMQAAPAPKGWMHPDDIAAGAQASAVPGGAVQAPPDSGAAPGAGPAVIAPGDAGSAQPGPIVPGRPGTDAPGDVHSEPGVPVADPKINGTGATGTATVPGTVDGKATGGAVAPATGAVPPPTAGGKSSADEGKSARPTPAPAPAPAAPAAPAAH